MAFKLVVVGASAGGLPALIEVLSNLPATFPLPILVVQHVDPHHQNLLPGILGRHTKLYVTEARHGERPRAGVVYVAPSNVHLTVADDGRIALTHDEPVRFSRPSVDRLFESAAPGRAIAIVLTGSGRDGAAGARVVSASGGVVIAENASSAAFSGMPQATIDTGVADYVLPLEQIPQLLISLAEGEASDARR